MFDNVDLNFLDLDLKFLDLDLKIQDLDLDFLDLHVLKRFCSSFYLSLKFVM